MSDESSRDLVKLNPHEKLNPREMNLDIARSVLQAIAVFQEESMTESSPLDKIGNYSIEDVRQAFQLVGENLLLRHEVTSGDKNGKTLKKEDPQGHVFLRFNYKPKGRNPSIDEIYDKTTDFDEMTGVDLDLTSVFPDGHLRNLMSFDFSLRDPESELDLIFINFQDGRDSENVRHINYKDIIETFNLNDYRFMIRGLRWLSINMLKWEDKGLIMPEQLNNSTEPKPLPQKTSLKQKLRSVFHK